MRSFLFALLFVLVMSGVTNAQDHHWLVDKGYQTADHISRSAPHLTADQVNQVDRLLTQIHQILVGATPVTPKMICVSRDNDGMRPFIIAIEKNPASVIRQPNLAFDSEAECLESVNSARMFEAHHFLLLCSSRDGDGRDPWKLSKIDLDRAVTSPISQAVTLTKANCFQQILDIRDYGDGFSVCVSRDSDGRDPWKLMMFFYNGTSSTRPEEFASYAECKKKL